MSKTPRRRKPTCPPIREVEPPQYWIMLAMVLAVSGIVSGTVVWGITATTKPEPMLSQMVFDCIERHDHAVLLTPVSE